MPAMILSTASSISSRLIAFLRRLAVRIAASLSRLARSAPVNPGVLRATFFKERSSSSFLSRACTSRIASRPLMSGASTLTCLSKRPGRISAESSTSGRFVAAIMMIPLLPSNPSISVNSWFRVCSRSSFPPPIPAPRCRPTASISSIKIRQGVFSFARLNKSRTRLAPTPTNISTNSEPESEKKGTPASPAIALASSVLPVPGGPTSRTPLGI
ncbi:MAG: Uncharacterised protein [Prochlorococcus marinus str. MIT 9313]|nr:MAG: Uncharacterised protein [Prochlorococcus marinus str. MIT 9313]